MTAYIYDTESLKIIKRYDSMRGAKSALTRARKSGSMRYMTSFGYGRMKADRIANLDVCTAEEFAALDYEIEVKNLMGGGTVKIKKSDEGSCVDPSTERYWSM